MIRIIAPIYLVLLLLVGCGNKTDTDPFLESVGTDPSAEAGPPAISYAAPVTATAGTAETLTPTTLTTNGANITNCSVSPSLPNGLSIHSTTCVISGSANKTRVATNYTITATNSAGSGTASLNLTVNPGALGDVVTTFAGKAVYAGDDGPLKDAGFETLRGMVYDSQGNLFVADSRTIRKITPQGVVSTLAGSVNYSGSADGTGSAAKFNSPTGIAIDSSDNIFVADYYNHTIRKITPEGVVTTIAGLAEVFGSDDGTGSAARFYYPIGLAVDSSNNIFVVDKFNHTIRKITPAGVVTTIAGLAGSQGTTNASGTAARFWWPTGIALDSSDNLFVTDTSSHTIRKINSSGVVTTIAGFAGVSGSADGTGSAARFNNPFGVAVDSSNNLYVADTFNHTIRKITPEGVVTTIAGQAGVSGSADGTGTAARLWSPAEITLDNSGDLIVTDAYSIRKIGSGNVVTTVVTTLAGPTKLYNGSGSVARFNSPAGMDIDSQRNIYVADYKSHTIRKITPAGVVTTFAGTVGEAGFINATGTAAKFNLPIGIAIDTSNNLYVVDSSNSAIRKITPAGLVTTFAGSTDGIKGSDDGTGTEARFQYPQGITIDSQNNLYVADTQNFTVRKITPLGVVTTLAGTVGNYGHMDDTGSAAQFFFPEDLTVDQDGNIFVTDFDRDNGELAYIRKITQAGVVSTVAGGYTSQMNGFADGPGLSASFGNSLFGITNDGAGNLYVADFSNNLIRKLDSSFNVTTIAGSPSQQTGRDNGEGTNATFSYPLKVIYDPTGFLFVADSENRTIRKID